MFTTHLGVGFMVQCAFFKRVEFPAEVCSKAVMSSIETKWSNRISPRSTFVFLPSCVYIFTCFVTVVILDLVFLFSQFFKVQYGFAVSEVYLCVDEKKYLSLLGCLLLHFLVFIWRESFQYDVFFWAFVIFINYYMCLRALLAVVMYRCV